MHRWQAQSGIRARLDIEAELELSPSVELQLMRIIQEALANARKHSSASTARVSLRTANGMLEASIEDDGAGFDPLVRTPSAMPRFGLAIMRERAESIGGTLEVDTSPGGGTRVMIRIPTASEVL